MIFVTQNDREEHRGTCSFSCCRGYYGLHISCTRNALNAHVTIPGTGSDHMTDAIAAADDDGEND